MAFSRFLLPLFFIIISTAAQSSPTSCTTLQPVFAAPFNPTSTVFASTTTKTSAVDCSGCSLVVKIFSAVTETTQLMPTTTVTSPLTISSSYVCIASETAPPVTPSNPFSATAPTPSPIPSAKADAQALIDELATAFIYVALTANGGNLQKLCSAINPSALDNITGFNFNGSLILTEVCAAASLQIFAPSLAPVIVESNQQDFVYLATTLYAVQVAGNYAGGPDLATLCSDIQPSVIQGLFVLGSANAPTMAKDYVCSAASASASASHSAATPTPSASYPQPTNTTTSPTCTSPLGFGNTVVPVPEPLATPSFRVSTPFIEQHYVYLFSDLSAEFSRASVASFCLDQCVQYRANATTGPCLSFNVNFGKFYPPTADGDDAPHWFCIGFDAPLSADVFEPVDIPGSWQHPQGVNRVCNDSYRDY